VAGGAREYASVTHGLHVRVSILLLHGYILALRGGADSTHVVARPE
jgi:hypothetical protein